MGIDRRRAGLLILTAGAVLVARPLARRLGVHPSASAGSWDALHAQEQAPNRPEFTVVGRNFRYSPDRIEVTQDDLVKVTIRSEDVAYSFAIDEYRIVRRVPPGGTTTVEFHADRVGTFRFYSNLTSESGHREMQGRLVVRPR